MRHTRLTASSSSSAAVRLYPRIAPASAEGPSTLVRRHSTCVTCTPQTCMCMHVCTHASTRTERRRERETKAHRDTQMTHTQRHRHTQFRWTSRRTSASAAAGRRRQARTLHMRHAHTHMKMRSNARVHALDSKENKNARKAPAGSKEARSKRLRKCLQLLFFFMTCANSVFQRCSMLSTTSQRRFLQGPRLDSGCTNSVGS